MRISAYSLLILFSTLLSPAPASAQMYAGINLGPAYGRTVDAGLMLFPKNEDWLSFQLSGGYTFAGPMYFPRKKAECLANFRNGGWHVRLGARNGFTTQHHSSHLFWGLDLIFSRQNESALLNACDTASAAPMSVSQNINVVTGAINLGYTWNPFHKKTIYQLVLIDFGLRVGYPFWSSAPLLGERDYISGAGFTWFPIRSLSVEPMAILRFKLVKGRYGFFKRRERKRFYD
ncbi:MAG: hypothetical protein AAGN35_04425 [Bacteroidota bacterium]